MDTTVATPTGNQPVAAVNAARENAFAMGGDPYKAAPTNVSKAAGLGTTPTVMTDANIRENVIPNIQQQASKTLPQGTPATSGSTINGIDAQSLANFKAANPGLNFNPDDLAQFLKTGSAPTKTTGTVTDVAGDTLDPSSPTYYSDLYQSLAGNLENDPDAKNELAVLDNMKTAQDASSKSSIDSLTSAYNTRLGTLKNSQDTTTRRLNNTLAMSGASRYSPTTSNQILSNKEQSDASAISDLQDKENTAIAAAQKAQQDGDFKVLGEQLKIVDGIRSDKNALASKLTTDMSASTKTMQDNAKQSQRDSAVADVIENGVTDPVQILTHLNTSDPNGNYTAKEVEDVIKSLSPTGNLTGLSSSLKDFYTLKGQKMLPSNISTLPEDQQLGAYLHYVKVASSISGGTGAAGAKITLSNAKTLGLPISTVGMTQKDIVDSLKNSTPPAWFVEKLSNDTQQSIDPRSDSTTTAWQAFQKQETDKIQGTSAKANPNYDKALQYFTTTYDGLSDDQADQIAQQVVTYVDGGMTYAKAVAQTEQDLK